MRKTFFTVAMLLASGVAPAATLFTSPGGGNPRTGDDFTLGVSFNVLRSGMLVTNLGIYDLGGAFGTDHQLGLWDNTAGGAMVASATFLASSTNASTPAGFLFISVTPVLLVNGDNYTLAAFYPSSTFGSGGDQLLDTGGSPATDPNFDNLVSRFSTDGSFDNPGGGAGSNTAYVGPNLEYAISVAPEPASWTLVLAGAALLAARNRIRRASR